MTWHFHGGSTPPGGSLTRFLAASNTTTEAKKRESLNDRQPRKQPKKTRAHRTPGVAPQNKSWRSQVQFSNQVDRTNRTRTERSTQYTKHALKTSRAAFPSPFSAGGVLSAPSVHPKDRESDSFLSLRRQKQKTKEAGGGAHATTHAFSLSSTLDA